MYKIVEFSHLLIEEFYNRNKRDNLIFIDATCGRGNDTLKLAQTLHHTGTIIAYDIQQVALHDTQELLEKHGYDDVIYHLQSHDKLIEKDLDLIIYNLGYLPRSDKKVRTEVTTTLRSIKKALDITCKKEEYLIIIVIYPGHKEGLEESEMVDEFCKMLPSKFYLITKYQNYNRPTSPYIITIGPNKNKNSTLK